MYAVTKVGIHFVYALNTYLYSIMNLNAFYSMLLVVGYEIYSKIEMQVLYITNKLAMFDSQRLSYTVPKRSNRTPVVFRNKTIWARESLLDMPAALYLLAVILSEHIHRSLQFVQKCIFKSSKSTIL